MPEALDKLIAGLGRLPGVGRRSAERMAMAILRDPAGTGAELAGVLQVALQHLTPCKWCGNITLRAQDPCPLCTDPRRDTGVLCVVEEPADILNLERSGAYRGRYHALMGRLSPMRGEGVRNLRVDALVERVRAGSFKEVVLALNSDVESDATAAYLQEVLATAGVKVTRLARGIPAGSGLSYTDAITLARAFENRRSW
ncbi:MAG TPA: recombination mediator RecR [Kiritimatiellia bacterium]|nr:recombination mediator RecR [Kiritimatiellia bacterium]